MLKDKLYKRICKFSKVNDNLYNNLSAIECKINNEQYKVTKLRKKKTIDLHSAT